MQTQQDQVTFTLRVPIALQEAAKAMQSKSTSA